METIVGECINALKKGWTLFPNQRSLERDMESLREKTNELSAREQDVITEVQSEEMVQGKKRKREVDAWLKSVERLKDRVDSIEKDVTEQKGWIWRYKLRERILDIETEVVQLREKSEFSCGVAIESFSEGGNPQPAAKLLGESANRILRVINDHLSDGNVGKVGVHGMTGVGKTTIMKHICNELLNSSNGFKSVIWVTASKALNLSRLQCEIANAIRLDLSNACDDEESASSKIYAALLRRGKCLLILDDLQEPFSLERIGIPEPNQINGFKLAITTRSLMVCRGMETERMVQVEALSDEEAWELLKEKVGEGILESSEIKSIAKLIIDECGRVPLKIISVGRKLREVGDVSVWRNVLNDLKRSCTEAS